MGKDLGKYPIPQKLPRSTSKHNFSVSVIPSSTKTKVGKLSDKASSAFFIFKLYITGGSRSSSSFLVKGVLSIKQSFTFRSNSSCIFFNKTNPSFNKLKLYKCGRFFFFLSMARRIYPLLSSKEY